MTMVANCFELILLCVFCSCQLSGTRYKLDTGSIRVYIVAWPSNFTAGSNSPILSPPTSQEVILNRNTSFTCTSTTNKIKWVINGSHNGTKVTIYPSDWQDPIPNRSISHTQDQLSDDTFINILVVLGSFENNNTEIDCQIYGTTQPATETTPALLTVIGIKLCTHMHKVNMFFDL